MDGRHNQTRSVVSKNFLPTTACLRLTKKKPKKSPTMYKTGQGFCSEPHNRLRDHATNLETLGQTHLESTAQRVANAWVVTQFLA